MRFRLALGIVTAVGFLWRLAYALISKGSDSNLFDEGDAFYYRAVADNLAARHWFVNPFGATPTAEHPPLTVLVLGPTARIFHESVLAQRLTMTVVGTVVIAAIGLLGRRLAGPGAGIAAAAVAAINPNLWMNDALIMSESISTLLIVATMAAGFALARNPSVLRAATAGALCGLTALARAEIGLFLPLMIVPILLLARELSWRQRLARMLLAAAVVAALIAPWAAWNQSRFNDTVLLSTNDGTTLLGANCPSVYYSGIIGGWDIHCVEKFPVGNLDASQVSARQRHEAWSYLTTHKRRLALVSVARVGRTFGFWRPDQSAYINQGEGRSKWASWTGFAVFWVLIPISTVGAWMLRRARVTLIPIAAAVATVVLVSGLFYGLPRFRLPVDVATCLLSGVAIAAWLRRATGSPATGSPTR